MIRLGRFLTILVTASLCGIGRGWAQDNIKLAQTGMQFLSVVSDARGTAMAGAMTAVSLQSASLFYNPACMANTTNLVNVTGSYNQWIADIKHTEFSLSVRPAGGDFGVIGLSAQVVDYGQIIGTRVADNPQGYEDTGDLRPTALAVGVGYAKALSEAFAVGIHVKWVRQSLGESMLPAGAGVQMVQNRAEVLAFDFGTIFKTGLKSLAFGMSVRNFSKEVKFQDESFSLPLTFTLGLSFDAMDMLQDRSFVNSIILDVDAIHNRDYREQVFLGGECNLLNVIALRAGYVTASDEAGVTLGIGVHQMGIEADYSYTPFGVFDKVQRVTVRYSM